MWEPIETMPSGSKVEVCWVTPKGKRIIGWLSKAELPKEHGWTHWRARPECCPRCGYELEP